MAFALLACEPDTGPAPDHGRGGVAPSGKFLRAERPLAGQYIVAFQDANVRDEEVEGHAEDLARRHDGAILFTWRHALRGFAVKMSEPQAHALAQDPRVAWVEEDAEGHAGVTQTTGGPPWAGLFPPVPWGLDRIDQRALPLDNGYTYNGSTASVSVYILDTGIRATHAEFGSRASGAFTAINDGNGTNDCNGHGTHVAGIIGGATYGVAKEARLFAVRVCDCSATCPLSAAIAGINWVSSQSTLPAVANMSLVFPYSRSLNSAVGFSSATSGVTYAVAAGNANLDACGYSPRNGNVITVGASDISDARAAFSNFGACVSLFAPGVGIKSAWPTSDTAWLVMDGTSMATPHVTGTAARYLSANPGASPVQVKAALLNGATPGVLGGLDGASPNLLLYKSPIF